jgi:hypothetical protein
MGFIHFIGFCLIIAGAGLVALFCVFILNSQTFNPAFLYCLGLGCLVLLFSGVVILKKSG